MCHTRLLTDPADTSNSRQSSAADTFSELSGLEARCTLRFTLLQMPGRSPAALFEVPTSLAHCSTL